MLLFILECKSDLFLVLESSLQKGASSTYLLNNIEVMTAIAAPSYDAVYGQGKCFIESPRTSFRSRLKGWNAICLAVAFPGSFCLLK